MVSPTTTQPGQQSAINLVVETKQLTKRYKDVLAVDSLSLSIPKGGVFGLLGPNGSGKSTTLGMVLGLVRPTSGSVKLLGEENHGTAYNLALRRTGAVVETPSFYLQMSGWDNLRYFQGLSGRDDPKELGTLLEMVELKARAKSKFHTYSLGMKQRLGIAYSLLGSPELVILDEPTNGLDPAGMAEVRALLKRLASGGRTIILSSHLLHEVEMVCDHVAILSRGKLIANGSVRELLRQRGGGVLFKTTDNARAVMILREKMKLEVDTKGGALSAAVDLERSWELTKTLAENGVYVIEMAPTAVSLESYFLEVIGDAEDKEKGKKKP